jgi:hypothetical protein
MPILWVIRHIIEFSELGCHQADNQVFFNGFSREIKMAFAGGPAVFYGAPSRSPPFASRPLVCPKPFRLLGMALNQRARILRASFDDMRLGRGCRDR